MHGKCSGDDVLSNLQLQVLKQIRCAVDTLHTYSPPSSFALHNKHGLTERSGKHEAKTGGFIPYSANINADFCMAVIGIFFPAS